MWRVSRHSSDHTADFLTLGGARLACRAFRDVFQKRQTKFAVLLAWLDDGLVAAWPTSRAERRLLEGAAGG